MKKRVVVFTLVVAIVMLSCFMLVGCFGDSSRVVQVNGLVLKLYHQTDDGKEEISLDSQLMVGEKYKFEFSCDIMAETSSDTDSVIEINILLPPVKIANAFISDTNSGSSQTIEFNNADTGEVQREGSVIFKIPNEKKVVKNLHGELVLEPIMVGNSVINILFSSANNVSLRGDSNDGYTKTIVIKNNKIDTPSIKYENESIKWKHVKYADYYVIYVDNNELKDADGKVIMVDVDKYTSVGSEIVFNKLPEYLVGAHKVSIRAFNQNASYQVSDYSNEVSVEL